MNTFIQTVLVAVLMTTGLISNSVSANEFASIAPKLTLSTGFNTKPVESEVNISAYKNVSFSKDNVYNRTNGKETYLEMVEFAIKRAQNPKDHVYMSVLADIGRTWTTQSEAYIVAKEIITFVAEKNKKN